MKKLFISMFLLLGAAVSLQAENVLVQTQSFTVTVDAEGNETLSAGYSTPTYYYYNAKMQNSLTYGGGFSEYEYNEKGQLSAKYVYSDYYGAFQNYTAYTYDEEGNLVKTEQQTSWGSTVTEYSDFINGQYRKVSTTSNGYTNTNDVLVSFDENKKILRRYGQVMSSLEVFTYNADGTVAQVESQYIQDGNLESTLDPTSNNYSKKVYSYNKDGKVAAIRNITSYSTMEEQYTYEDLKGENAPCNLKAEANKDNTVNLSWDAVAGAEGYKVTWPISYKNDSLICKTNSVVTPVLVDGDYTFVVQPIFGGVAKNLVCERKSATVKDTSKVPATDFAFAKAVHDTVMNSWGYPQEVYTVTVNWKEPDSSVVTGRVLSYGTSDYDTCHIYDVTIDDKGLCTGKADISAYSCVDQQWNEDWTEHTDTPKDMTLGVYLMYKTGLAALSNTQVVRVAEVATDPVALDAVRVNNAAHAIYNLNGQRQQNLKTPGLYIVDGRKVQIR